MNWKKTKWRVRYYWQYFPFTLNTLLCAAAGWGAYELLYKPPVKGEDPSPVMPFIILMGKMVELHGIPDQLESLIETGSNTWGVGFVWGSCIKGRVIPT